MVLTQEELNEITRKRYPSRAALATWIARADAVLAECEVSK